MSSLNYMSISNDYIKFLQRILSFYSYNFKQATSDFKYQDKKEARHKLKKLIFEIIPSCRQLKKILKEKRKMRKHKCGSRKRFHDSEFPYDDENIIYIVILKILQSYYVEFGQSIDLRKNAYFRHFLPLALEFYKNHVNSSDLILVSSLIRYLNAYFPNLQKQRFLVTKEDHILYL